MTQIMPASALLALSLLGLPALADLSADQRLAAEMRTATELQGELVELEAQGTTFVAIHRPLQQGGRRGAIVLLHDQAGNPDSPEVLRPLRLALAEAGWDTLSLQLPSAARGAPRGAWMGRRPTIEARLRAGLDWFKARGLRDQVIIALGDSGSAALQAAAGDRPPELRALVLISLALQAGGEAADAAALRDLDVPLLDIYAERDTPSVVQGAASRKGIALQAQEGGYRQMTIPGAVAGFAGLEASLVHAVRAWLAANAAGQAVGQTR